MPFVVLLSFGNSLYHYEYKPAKLQSAWFFVSRWFLRGPFTLKDLASSSKCLYCCLFPLLPFHIGSSSERQDLVCLLCWTKLLHILVWSSIAALAIL